MSRIRWRACLIPSKSWGLNRHATWYPCPWSCSVSWCLAGD